MSVLTADIGRGPAAAVALLVAALLLAAASVALPLWYLHARYDAAIERYSTRYAREMGIAATAQTWRDAIEAARAANPDRLYLKSGSVSLAGSELQDRIQKAFEAAGGKVSSIQVLPPRDEAGSRRIGVNVSGSASMPAIQRILHGVESSEVVLLVDALSVRAGQGRTFRPVPGVEPEFGLQFSVFGFMKGTP